MLLPSFRKEYEINEQFQNILNHNAQKYCTTGEYAAESKDIFSQETSRFIMKALILKFLEFRQGAEILNIIPENKEPGFIENLILLKYSPVGLAGIFGGSNKIGQAFLSRFSESEDFSLEISADLHSVLKAALGKVDAVCTGNHLFTTPDRNVLGDIYEFFADGGQKKTAGKYYTPEFIVDYILDKTLSKADITANPYLKVLDPACGCGHFLFKAYDLLKNKFRQNLSELRKIYKNTGYFITDASGGVSEVTGEKYWQEENLHYHLLRHCLFGADIDRFAVQISLTVLMSKEVARFRANENFQFYLSPNIIDCDSLTRWELNLDFSDSKTRRDFWSDRYDYIVGNPPYVSFGLKRTSTLKHQTAAYLRQNYPNSAEYKISYYALFLERAIELLAPGGRVGFITPDSFLLGRYFSKIRRFILDNCFITELVLLNQPIFTANVGFPVISLFQKKGGPPPANPSLHLIKAKKWQKNKSAPEHIEEYTYCQDYFERQPYFRFRLFFSEADKSIIDKMDGALNILKDVAKIKTGMRSLTSQKDVIASDLQQTQAVNSNFKRGIISSAEVKRFFITYRGNWLDVDPAKLNSGGWDKSIIERPKILIRQTGNFLIAAIDEDRLYHLNNVHSISLANDAVCLEYILCLLNSNLLNYYYQTISLEMGRTMAQTDIETLEKLPIVIDCKSQEFLTNIARKLKRTFTLFPNLKNSPSPKEKPPNLKERLLTSYIKRLNTDLNQTIYKLYGLTEAEICYVESRSLY